MEHIKLISFSLQPLQSICSPLILENLFENYSDNPFSVIQDKHLRLML